MLCFLKALVLWVSYYWPEISAFSWCPLTEAHESLSHCLSPGSPERSWIWPGGLWGLTLERSRHLLRYRNKLQVRSWWNCSWFVFFSSVYICPPWEWLPGDTPTSSVYKNIYFFGGWEDGEFLKRKKYTLYTSRFSNTFAQSTLHGQLSLKP